MGEVKLCLFADFMTLYLKYPKGYIRSLLDLRNTSIKVAGFKINLQKLLSITL
jgi:hypothetical protein